MFARNNTEFCDADGASSGSWAAMTEVAAKHAPADEDVAAQEERRAELQDNVSRLSMLDSELSMVRKGSLMERQVLDDRLAQLAAVAARSLVAGQERASSELEQLQVRLPLPWVVRLWLLPVLLARQQYWPVPIAMMHLLWRTLRYCTICLQKKKKICFKR